MKRVQAVVLLITVFLTAVAAIPVSYADARPAAKDIPNQTLIVGTYLIHLTALDKENLSLAEQSAENSGQKRIFYKSELAKGEWMDISNKDTVDNLLTTKGKIVSNAEIDSIPLTHWAKDPGKIIDLSTGATVSARDITEPDNDLPAGMKFLEKELEDTTNEKKMLQRSLEISESEDSDEDDDEKEKKERDLKDKLHIINQIYNAVTGAPEYLDYEKKLAAIQGYKDYINRTHTDKRELYMTEVLELEQAVLTGEKLFVINLVADRVKAAINSANDKAWSDITKALSSTSSALTEAVDKLANTLPGASSDVLGEEKGILQKSLLDEIYANKYPQADLIMEDILNVNNIANNLIKEKESELTVLRRIQERVLVRLKDTAFIGNNSEYKKAKAAGESKAVLDTIIEANAQRLKSMLKDAGFIKEEILKRLDSVDDKITEIEDLKGQIAAIIAALNNEGYEGSEGGGGSGSSGGSEGGEGGEGLGQASSNQAAIKIQGDFLNALDNELKNLKASVNEGLSGTTGEKEKLLNRLEELKEEYLSAVEAGDMALVSSLKDEMNGVLEALSSYNENIVDELNRLNAEKKELQGLLDKAVLEGNSALAKELEDKIGLTDVMITGLLGLLNDKDKNLLNDFMKQAEGILTQMETPDTGFLDRLEASVKELMDTYNSFDDKYKSFLDKDGIMGEILDAVQDLYDRLSENGDSSSAARLLKLLNTLSGAAESMEMTLDDREAAAILKLLIEYSPVSEKMQEYVSMHYSYLNETNKAKDSQSIYRNSFLSVKNTADPGIQSLIVSFSKASGEVLIAEKKDLVSRFRLAVAGRNIGVDIEAARLDSFIQYTLLQLMKKERGIYTSEELENVRERKEFIEETFGYKSFDAGEVVFASSNIKFMNPVIMSGEPYLPIRDAFTGLGGSVVWVGTEMMAAVNYNGMEIKILPDSNEVYVNGGRKDTVDIMKLNGHIFIPAGLFEEITGYVYEYDKKNNLLLFTME